MWLAWLNAPSLTLAAGLPTIQTNRPQPGLRRDIPKGNGKTRPLGIASLADKIVQRAVVMILERTSEEDFIDSSFGFRPGPSCHQALKALGHVIGTQK